MATQDFGRQPVRFTGQHFTKNTSLIQEMVQKAMINTEDMVLDIGAGKGALTEPLSHTANRVIAIERDSSLANKLKHKYAKSDTVKILKMDIRDMPLPNDSFKVVSNIPYCITTDILGKLMDTPINHFEKGSLVIQWGMALRLTKSRQSNPRLVGWNTWFDIQIIRKVSPRSFYPPPTVDSAIITISKRKHGDFKAEYYYDYMSFVASMLSTPGKLTKDALRVVFTRTQVNRIMSDAKINRNSLIQDLNISQWQHCFLTMKKLIPKAMHPSMPGKYKQLFFKN